MRLDAIQIIDFWSEAGEKFWFAANPAFDEAIKLRFAQLYEIAARGDLYEWTESAAGVLALVLLLDQFPRNMFRNTRRAFATDARALDLAQKAVARGYDARFALPLKRFFYLPFMHAENLAQQRRAEALLFAAGDAFGCDYARIHREIIERFGRFPHRNPILRREMTAEEQAFLDNGGFAG